MTEWFCEKCCRVWFAKCQHECCGDVVIFDMSQHGRRLLGKSNSWINLEKRVSARWKTHALYLEAVAEFAECGNSSASGILSLFIDKLIELNQKA